ncbi:MAG: hypothetical protein WKF37_11155 [Bryobacteraceae bacterium]
MIGPARDGERVNEKGGILFGRVQESDSEEYAVSIEQAEVFDSLHRRSESYSFSGGEDAAFAKQLRKQRGSLTPVGYFRSHTRPGLYLDEYDFQLMKIFFTHPASVALVIRPEVNSAPQAGFFVWAAGDMKRAHSYLEFALDARLLLPEATIGASPPVISVPPVISAPPVISKTKSGSKLRSVCIAVTVAFLTFAVIAPFTRTGKEAEVPIPVSGSTESLYSLQSSPVASGLRLTWNPGVDRIAHARKGVLWIDDGPGEKRIDLTQTELKSGSLDYVPSSSEVKFRLEVDGFSESIRTRVPIVIAAVESKPEQDMSTPPRVPMKPEEQKKAPAPAVKEPKPNALPRAAAAVPGLGLSAPEQRRKADYEPPLPTRRYHPPSSKTLNQRVSVSVQIDSRGTLPRPSLLAKT